MAREMPEELEKKGCKDKGCHVEVLATVKRKAGQQRQPSNEKHFATHRRRTQAPAEKGDALRQSAPSPRGKQQPQQPHTKRP